MKSISRCDLYRFFSDTFNPKDFSDFAPNGLQIEGAEKINNITFSVSADLEAIRTAVKNKSNALVVHHGLLLHNREAAPIVGPLARKIRLLMNHDINLFAYHLPLDGHPKIGNSLLLAKKLGVKQIRDFGFYKGKPCGVAGSFLKALDAESLKKKLEAALAHPVITATPQDNRPIKTIGIISGGARGDWIDAYHEKLDAYVTGESSEQDWLLAREHGLHLFIGGHHATERFGIEALKKEVEKKFKIPCHFFDSHNPM